MMANYNCESRSVKLAGEAVICGTQSVGFPSKLPQLGHQSFRRIMRRDFNPLAISMTAEPRELPLGELAGFDFDEFNGCCERMFAAQMLHDLPVADGLQGKFIFCKAVFQ